MISAIFNLFKRAKTDDEVVADLLSKYPIDKYDWSWPGGGKVSHPPGALRWAADGEKMDGNLIASKQADGLHGIYMGKQRELEFIVSDKIVFKQDDLEEIFEDVKRQRKQASEERQASYEESFEDELDD